MTQKPKFLSSKSHSVILHTLERANNSLIFVRFDHLHFKSSEFEPYTEMDQLSEPWRAALEKDLTTYVNVHYKSAACSVYGSSDQGLVSLVACTEAHKFQPSNFW